MIAKQPFPVSDVSIRVPATRALGLGLGLVLGFGLGLGLGRISYSMSRNSASGP